MKQWHGERSENTKKRSTLKNNVLRFLQEREIVESL